MTKYPGLKRKKTKCGSRRTATAAAVIPSPLSDDERRKRKSCNNLLVEKITDRLRGVAADTDIQELKKLQEMICDLRKVEISAEKVEIDRAVAQSALAESARDEEIANRSPGEIREAIRRIADDVYGISVNEHREKNPADAPALNAESTENVAGDSQEDSAAQQKVATEQVSMGRSKLNDS